ncbi:MAG: hypothetical protein M3Q98_00190 [Actinomycetota bacterium]|nr:hypothetical protein [Actinomycetota bacterium]
MSDSSSRTPKDAGGDEDTRDGRRRDRTSSGPRVKEGLIAARGQISSVIWLIAVICAVFLALGALLIALKANPDNVIRELVVGGADRFDGPLSRENGLFTFDGRNGATKEVLVNWGLAAITYLVAGSILRRIVRPQS